MCHKWGILKTVAETPFTEPGRGRICGEGPTTLSAGFVSRDRDYKLRTRKIFGSPANVTCTQHFGSIAKNDFRIHFNQHRPLVLVQRGERAFEVTAGLACRTSTVLSIRKSVRRSIEFYYFSVCSSKYYRRCASNYELPVLHRRDCTTEIGKA